MVRDSRQKLLDPGDLIEFKNVYDLYAHWGVYAGDGDVIHVIGDVGNDTSLPNSVAEGFAAAAGDTYVRRNKVLKVTKGRTFFKNNQLDNSYTPLPRDQIVAKAVELVGSKWDYKLLSSNCEHFASEMRYGVPISLQSLPAQQLVDRVHGRVSDFTQQVVNDVHETVYNYDYIGLVPERVSDLTQQVVRNVQDTVYNYALDTVSSFSGAMFQHIENIDEDDVD